MNGTLIPEMICPQTLGELLEFSLLEMNRAIQFID